MVECAERFCLVGGDQFRQMHDKFDLKCYQNFFFFAFTLLSELSER
jgi:hypothetical protein